jgi:hypothetical protein
MRRDTREGWILAWRNAFLRASMLYPVSFNFIATGLLFGVILIAGGRAAGGTPIGAAPAIASAGGIVGAAIAPQAQRRFSVRRSSSSPVPRGRRSSRASC